MSPAAQHAQGVCPPAAAAAAAGGPDAGSGAAAGPFLDVTDGNTRYAGYAGRLGQLARAAERISGVRHLAYASDVGEAARPVVPRWVVNASYATSIGYVAADVVAKGAAASASGATTAEVTRTSAQTAVFQGLASILAPFLIIHSQVHLFQKLLRNTPAAKHGPTAAGLALIPLLPLVDEPIEHGACATRLQRTRVAVCFAQTLTPRVRVYVCVPASPAVEHAFDTAWPAEEHQAKKHA